MTMNDLYAWCIVPFDSVKRTPQERVDMLKRLGFNKYAYDWRIENLDEMAAEFRLADENDMDVIAVWMWLDARSDRVDSLSDANNRVFEAIREADLRTQIWVSFHPNFFEGLNDAEAVEKGRQIIGYLSGRAEEQGCKIGLYNHGDWFGRPENQIKIIEALPDYDIGLVYNFHHAHDQLDEYEENVKRMMPYLRYVNLNGMRREGPKIIPLGEGDLEGGMIQLLLDKGYRGPFGLLGHVENADVEVILKQNRSGFFDLMK